MQNIRKVTSHIKAQYKLLTSMEEQLPQMDGFIHSTIEENSKAL